MKENNDLGETQPNRKLDADKFLRIQPGTGDLISDETVQLMFQRMGDKEPKQVRWQIIVLPTEGEHPAMALEVYDDVIFGSSKSNPASVDINLYDWGGREKGVSRRHMLLRPTPSALYIVDLESTNGTLVNGLPLAGNQSRALESGDMISMGELTVRIKILDLKR